MLAYGVAQKAKEGWSAASQGSEPYQPDATSGWARPVRSVVGIGLGDVRCWKEQTYSEAGEAWMWSSPTQFTIADAEPLLLPLFAELASDNAEREAQKFVAALVQRL